MFAQLGRLCCDEANAQVIVHDVVQFQNAESSTRCHGGSVSLQVSGVGRCFGLLLSNTTTGDDNGNYLLANYAMGPQLMRGGYIRLSNPGSISVVIEGTELPQHPMRLFNQVVNL